MNLRALLLLTLFLLTQMGQAASWISNPATAQEMPPCVVTSASPGDVCQLPCCHRRLLEENCCCLKETPQNPAPPLPATPPPTGRDLVPQPLWTCLLVHFFFGPETEIPAATSGVPALSVPACSTRCVTLPVLHCAFLI